MIGSAKPSGYTVRVQPVGKTLDSRPGETLLDSARRGGVRIPSVCGGRGLCKTCVVRITEGPVPPPSVADERYFSPQELADNWRRACQISTAGDCTIEISARALAMPARTQVEGEDVYVQPDPVVHAFRATVPPPSLEEPVGDDNRLRNTLSGRLPGAGLAHPIDFEVLKALPHTLRDTKGQVDAVSRFGEIIGVIPSPHTQLLGLAIDIGTTNIGALLVNLRSGRTLTTRGLENPQGVHGADVISRLAHARRSPEGLRGLHDLIIEGVNGIAKALCESVDLGPEHIADVVVAGNTAMHHLFVGLPVDYLAVVPFVPAVSAPCDIKARDLGIHVMPGAYVHLLPNIAGFVGGDHVAVLLAIGSESETKTVLTLDIGTNTEISLIHKGEVSTLSCPSGPALEGGHIRYGMRSAPGAIEAVRIVGDKTELKTIDDAPPVGLCGSGVLDLCAQLYVCGATNAAGRMNANHPRVRQMRGKKELEFVVAAAGESGRADIVLTQGDVRAVQLAKGAIRAGIDILLEEAGIETAQLDEVTIAGAFGSYIDVGSAIVIGMLPDLPLDRFSQIGNAAGIGAKLALVSHGHRSTAEHIANRSKYIELSGGSRFRDAFMRALGYPPINSSDNAQRV